LPPRGYRCVSIPEHVFLLLKRIASAEQRSVPKVIEMLCRLYYLVRIYPLHRGDLERIMRRARRMKTERIMRMLHMEPGHSGGSEGG